ncbi:cupin domain-containing protein [Leptospira stimsonii]|uniref:Cupin domain-containing protein n=2 Tax=Leptospira stimsonii TaxID=2202203 RepID=A0A8B3CK81_9LEPT|nr:cupin domain-containing protein [Leptospira stimsonii]
MLNSEKQIILTNIQYQKEAEYDQPNFILSSLHIDSRGKMKKRTTILTLSILLAYILIGNFLHRFAFAEAEPDLSFYPAKGEMIENRFANEKIVFVTPGRDTNGKYSENDLYLQAKGAVPKPHRHADLEETFTILKGNLSLIKGDKKYDLKEGDSITVPKGEAHHPENKSDALVIVRVRATPAGKHDLMLAQVHGFFTEKETPRGKVEWILQAMLYSVYYETYMAELPIGFQKFLSFLISPVARLLGYKSWYPEYSLKWKRSEE